MASSTTQKVIPENSFSFKKRLKSFEYAFKGLSKAVKTQHNLWIHLTITILVVFSGFYFNISRTEWMAVFLAIGGVITAELINTAIEWTVDLITPEEHPLAGDIKDVAAGAVLFFAVVSAVIGLLVFLPHIIHML